MGSERFRVVGACEVDTRQLIKIIYIKLLCASLTNKIALTKNEMDDIASRLKESVNYDNAYFGIVEDVPHEYCIKANEDGLKLFAAELLASTNNDKENIRGLTPEELPWFDDHIELQFIELTGKSRAELIKPVQKTPSNEWLTKLGMWAGLILLIYFIITGIIFTIQLM